MAEYRGLTVRIGADTSSLSASLKAAQGAIVSTQKHLRTLKQALQMDPGSTKAASLYVGELQSQAVAAASKVSSLKSEMRELGETVAKSAEGKSIGDLAKTIDDVALNAQRAKQVYNGLTDDLAQYYTQISKLAKSAVEDFSKGLDKSLSKEERIEAIVRQMGDLVDASGKAIKVDASNNDINMIRAMLEQLHFTQAEIDEVIPEIERLQAEFRKASDAYDDAILVQKLHSDAIEAAKLEAQFKSLAEQMADADRGSDLSQGWDKAQEAIERLNTDADRAQAHFKALDEAAKIDPTNVDVLQERAKALAEAIVLTQGKAETLNEVLSSYEAKGFDTMSDSVVRAADNVQKFRDAYVEANTQVSRVRHELDEARLAVSELEEAGEQNTEGYAKAVARVQELEGKLVTAKEAAAQANAEFQKAKDISTYKDVKLEAEENSVALQKLREAYRNLAEVQVKAQAPTELQASWEKTSQQIGRFGDDIDRAKSRVTALDSQLKISPDSLDLLIEKSRSMGEALDLSEAKAAKLRSALEQYEAAGVDKAAQGIESVTDNLDKAEQKAIEAAAWVNELTLELETLEDAKSKASGDELLGISKSIIAVKGWLEDAQAAAAEANEELGRAKDIVGYENVRTQLVQTTAATEELREQATLAEAELAKLAKSDVSASKSALSETIEASRKSIENFGNDVDSAKARVKALDDALKLDPENIDLATQRAAALESAMTSTRAKVDALQSLIDSFKAAGIDKVVAGTDNLAEAADKARQAFEKAREDVRRLQDEYADAAAKASKLGEGTTERIDADALVGNLKQRLDEATEASERLEQKWHELDDGLTMRNAETELIETREQLASLEKQSGKTAEELKKLGDAAAKAAADKLTESIKQNRAALTGLDSDIEIAQKSYEALSKSAKLSPLSIDAARRSTEALQKVTELTRQKAEELKRKLAEYKSAGIDKVASQTQGLSAAAESAKQKYGEAEANVSDLRDKLAEAYAHAAKLGEQDVNSEEYQNAAAEVDRLIDKLDEAETESSRLKSEMQTLGSAVDYSKMEAESAATEEQLKRLENAGKAPMETIGAAGVMILEQVGQMARQVVTTVSSATYDLEEAYTNMRKTVNATDEEYEALKDSAIASSLIQPVSADQILNVEALGGQLDFAVDELEEFQRVANGLDISTNMSWEDAATDMAQFANIMKMDHSDVGRYGSAIVELGNNFATTEADISDMAMRIAGAGASMKLSSADVLGLATALTSMGLTAEAGGSSISQIMVKVDKAVANGTAGIEEYADQAGMSVSDFIDTVKGLEGDELNDFAKQFGKSGSQLVKDTVDQVEALKTWAETAGMTSDEFVKAWETEPVKALEALFSGMEEAGEEGTNLNILLEKLGINTIRQSDVARRLANNSGKVTEAVEAANRAWDENIALDTEVARRNESLSGRMDVLKNSLTAIKTELGEGLAPIVAVVTGALQGVVKVLSGMSVGAKAAIITIAGVSSALAVAIPIVSKLSEHLAKLGGGSVIAGIKSIGQGIVGFITNPVALAAVGVGALLAVVANYAMKAAEHKRKQDEFNAALEAMGGYAQYAADNSDKLADSLKPVTDQAHHSAASVEELTAAITAHNDKMNEIQTSYEVDANLMSEYKKVLDEVKGSWNETTEQYELSAEQMSIAQWALDGLNQQLGTNVTMEELLTGKYEDENGVIQSTVGMLDELIAKREKEAKVSADHELVTEATKNRFRADRNLYDAEMQLAEAEEFIKQKRQEIMDQGFDYNTANAAAEKMVLDEFGMSYEEMGEAARNAARDSEAAANEQKAAMDMLANDDALTKVTDDVTGFYAKLDEAGLRSDALANISTDAFNEMLNKCGGDINQLAQDVIDYTKASSDTLSAMRRLSRYTPEFEGAFEGIDMEAFATALDEAGGSIEDLEQIGREGFDSLVESTGGNIDEMVARLASTTDAVEAFLNDNQTFGDSLVNTGISLGYFAKQCEDAGINSEMLAQVGQDNFANLANACNGDVGLMLEKIAEFNAARLEGKDVVIDANGNVVDRSAQEAVDDYNSAVDEAQDKSVTVSADGNVADGSAATNIWDAVRAMWNLTSKTVTQTVRRVFVGEQAEGGYRLHADGGIRKHADGFIANRYGAGVPLDIVGEAGAEAIIPLTNRRYSQPFADLLAEMISKHGGTGEGQIVNVNLNYSAGEDANQLARDLARAISMHKATRGRW